MPGIPYVLYLNAELQTRRAGTMAHPRRQTLLPESGMRSTRAHCSRVVPIHIDTTSLPLFTQTAMHRYSSPKISFLVHALGLLLMKIPVPFPLSHRLAYFSAINCGMCGKSTAVILGISVNTEPQVILVVYPLPVYILCCYTLVNPATSHENSCMSTIELYSLWKRPFLGAM